MKKLTLLLSAMLLALATNLQANEVTFTHEDLKGQGASGSGANFTGATKDNITMGGKGNGNSSYVQIYSNGTLTFTPLNGATITKIVLTATNGYIKTWAESKVALTISGNTATWTGSSTTMVTLTNTASAQARITKMVVTYTLPAAAVADPTISANEGTVENNGFYTSTLKVTLACETKGAEIHYTTDGSEPTAESATYSEVLTFTNEFVTLRAKAFKGEEASYEAKANYYHNSSLEVPYTTTQAVALYNALLKDVAEVFVEGQVTDFSYSDEYENADYTITDGTTPLKMYHGVASLDCGLANLADLVQGDNVVVNGTLTAYYSTPQLGAGNKIVKWTENTNPVLTCAESVAFGNISSLVGTIPSKTLEVTAKNLTEDITATLSEDAAFTLDKSEFDVRNGGTIKISPVLTVGENTATLTLTSGEKSATVTLTATIQQAYTISWSVNGNVTSTSAVIEGENLVLPATPEAPNECASKVFVGWATTASVAADGTGIVFVHASNTATADATYYAVFATATESTSATASVTFSDMFSGKTTNGSKDIDGEALDITDGITVTFAKSSSSSSKAQYFDNGKAVRLYGGGSITINSTTTITSFTLTFGEDDGSNAFTADCGTWVSPTWTGEANTVVLTEKGTSGNRRIAGISVTYKQTTWEEYTTTCTDTPSAIDNAAVETPAVKTIENGQLVILRDGVKYNAMGVRLQ